MDLQLQDQVAVVLGAASGIGRAIAAAFAQEGCRVALVDRDQRVREAAEAIANKCIAYVADVTDYGQVESLGRSIAGDLGPPRHVVYAVGAGSGKFGFPFW